MRLAFINVVVWVVFLFLVGSQITSAQSVSDIRFEQFGRAVLVHFNLSRLPYDSYALLNLYVSINDGVSFTGPLVRVQGDIGKVMTNGDKSVVWQAMDELGGLEGKVVFEFRGQVIKEKQQAEHLLMYNLSGSSSVGLMYGKVARWGGYVRLKTNLSFINASYTCNNSGVFNYEGDDYYVLDKVAKRSRLAITAGALYRPLQWLYLYAGAGYGFRRLIWHANTYSYADNQPTGDLWAVNTPHSAEGAEVELGAIFRYKRLGISAGVNTINFTFAEINGALGFFF